MVEKLLIVSARQCRITKRPSAYDVRLVAKIVEPDLGLGLEFSVVYTRESLKANFGAGGPIFR